MISLDLATTNTAKSYLMDKNKFHNNIDNQKNINNMSENSVNNNSISNSLTSDNTNVIDTSLSKTNTNSSINNTKEDLSKKLSTRLKNLLPSSSLNRNSVANSKPTAESIFASNSNNIQDSPQLEKRKSYTAYNNNNNNLSTNLAPDQKSFDFPDTPFRTPSPSRSSTFVDNQNNMEVHRSKSLLVPSTDDSQNRHSKPLPVEPSRQSSHFSTGSEALKLEDLDWLLDNTKGKNIHTNENGSLINFQSSSVGGGNRGMSLPLANDNTLKIQTKDLKQNTPDSNSSYINPDSAVDHNPLHLDEVINSMNSNQSATVIEGEEQSKLEGEATVNLTEENTGNNNNNVSYSDLDANQKRKNIEFHIYFPTLPLDDILLEDFHCALQRDILITGRLYLTSERVCFHSNLFGWVTHTIIPFKDIISIQKRSTAFVIPNAIQIATLDNKYFFTSFMARDATYSKLYEYWNRQCPTRAIEPVKTESSSNTNSQPTEGDLNGANAEGSSSGANTVCSCLKPGGKGHTGTVYIDTVVEMNIKDVFELMFGEDISFLNESIVKSEGYDIDINNWKTEGANSIRNYSYTKPLTAPMGPKSTKCIITDEITHKDFESYCLVVQKTQNPDVPSGSNFTIITNFCFMIHRTNQTRMIQSGYMEWSKSSWLKSVIENATREGITLSAQSSKDNLNAYLVEHPELKALPEGDDDSANNAAADNNKVETVPSYANNDDNSIFATINEQLVSLKPYLVHILVGLFSIILINVFIFWKSPTPPTSIHHHQNSPSQTQLIQTNNRHHHLPRLLVPLRNHQTPNYWQEVQKLKDELKSLKKQMSNIEGLLERFEGHHHY